MFLNNSIFDTHGGGYKH